MLTTPNKVVESCSAEQFRLGWRLDAVSALTVTLVLLFIVPARLVVPAIGAAGRPAVLLAIGLAGWWALTRVVPSMVIRGRQPVRTALLVFFVIFLLAYGLGYARGLPGIESRGSDRALIVMTSLVGMALVACDGIGSRERLDLLLRRLTYATAFMSFVGALQFVLGIDLASKIRLPGLALNRDLVGVGQRGAEALPRVAGTAGHAIEFGVLMAMVLPIALHYALHARSRAEGQRRWLIVAIIALGIPFSISRSATIGFLTAGVALTAIWSGRMRLKALIIAAVSTVLLQTAVPGLLGTIKSLFTNLGSDPSVQGRTQDYGPLFTYVADRPWFGRGPGTFLPERYILLDNEILSSLVSTGYVGLIALLGLLATAYFVARSVARHGVDDCTRHLGQALATTVLVAVVTSFTFDSLAFATFGGTLFIVIGAAGALGRLRDEPSISTVSERSPPLLRRSTSVHSDDRPPPRTRAGSL